MEYNDIARALLTAQYKTAKTMPTIPHEYTLLETWSDKKKFYDVCRYIRKCGYHKNFFKTVYTYLDVNGWQYWVMDKDIKDAVLINRARVTTQGAYDKIADGYDELYSKPEFKQEDKDLLEKLNVKGRVLDVGCGTGLFLDYVTPEDYIGFDPSQNMLNQLIAKHPQYADRVINTGAANFYDVDGFDTIISLYGSPNYIDPDTITRLNTMLRPGGKAYYMYYNKDYDVYAYKHTDMVPGQTYEPPKKGWPFTNYHVVEYENT